MILFIDDEIKRIAEYMLSSRESGFDAYCTDSLQVGMSYAAWLLANQAHGALNDQQPNVFVVDIMWPAGPGVDSGAKFAPSGLNFIAELYRLAKRFVDEGLILIVVLTNRPKGVRTELESRLVGCAISVLHKGAVGAQAFPDWLQRCLHGECLGGEFD